ncbi:HDOD domain-containing protein [Treponema porcinum]|uniref:HDOD domain-containing protein n=1 Tax=Treponema porcinum TaxID=261392 RepID=UPI003EFF47FD
MSGYLGSAQVLSKLPGNAEILWLHAYRVAFISYNIAKNYFPSDKELVGDSYVCGLMHDMGRILFEGIHPSYLEKVKDICSKKGIDINIFEKLLSGVNHAELGARIAEKWNFPQEIVDVVRYHHTPSAAPEASAVLVKIIFLADIMVHYISQEIDYYQIDKDILAYFKFSSQKQFDEVIEKLKSGYDSITF